MDRKRGDKLKLERTGSGNKEERKSRKTTRKERKGRERTGCLCENLRKLSH